MHIDLTKATTAEGNKQRKQTKMTTTANSTNILPLTEAEIEIKNNEYRAFMIARLQAVRDAETAQRKASGKAHLEREEAARKLGGIRDWSKQ